MRGLFFLTVGLLIFIGGAFFGRFSHSQDTRLLPTRLAATPINYRDEINKHNDFYRISNPTPMPALTGNLAEGQKLYQAHCAHCHGYRGEGEPNNPNPHLPDAIGYMPVPRHDSLGHTWLHPDQLLLQTIKKGIANPLSRYGMPPFEALLSDEEISFILNYIKLWWTEAQVEQQRAATERLRLAREDKDLLRNSD